MFRVVNKYNIIICAFLICSIIGLSLVTKYGYVDIISTHRTGVCEMENCTYLGIKDCRNYRDSYKCYETFVKYNLYGTNYTKSETLLLSYNFSCNNNVLCYYFVPNIEETLTLFDFIPIAVLGIMFFTFVSFMFAINIKCN